MTILPEEEAAVCLEEDLQRQLGRAAVPEEVGGAVQVDVVPLRKRGRGARVVAGPLELLGPPALDLGQFLVVNELCR